MPKMLIKNNGFVHSIRESGSPVKPKFGNVTESQQFKRWFGDWQNHPESASKVVNKDGTPKVVYHQTENEFSIPLVAFIKDWLGVVKEAYKAISGNEPELSVNIMYEIREGLGVKQELELYKGVDKAITTGDYTRLDKQFKTMVERDTTTDPTKKARETVRAAVRQYFDAGEVKAPETLSVYWRGAAIRWTMQKP